MDPETTIGPLVSDKQLKRVLNYIAIGRREGARTVIGGERAAQGSLTKGFYVEPTIFTGVEPNHTVAQEEIFGPVLSVLQYSDQHHALEITKDRKSVVKGKSV